MKTIYKNNITSPFQAKQEITSPTLDEVKKSLGTYNLTATVEEDKETLSVFKHVPGLIAFMATLKLGDSVLSIGRGTAVLNRMNKFVERGVRYAFNASLIDAVVRSSKTLDALYLKTIDQEDTGTPIEKLYENKISDNQKSYLRQLININVVDERERNRWESEIEDMTKDEASTAIQSFKK